jgi:hypothetical protein
MALALSRRDFARLSAAGLLSAPLSGWLRPLAAHAAQTGGKHKACILLWMDGGPSHKDTFDLKPGTANAGEFKPIQTSVPGIEISEHFPNLARLFQHGAILRGMSTGEGAHGRAKYYLHTGYKEGQGGLNYPAMGAIVASEIGRSELPLPNYVSIGARTYGSGYLGARHQPLIINDPNRGVENLRPMVEAGQFDSRVSLLEDMEKGFFREYRAGASNDHLTTYQRAVELMKSKEARALDLTLEPAGSREAYGSGSFGQGCLLARRLIEQGVSFVEVTLGGWDTHQSNFPRVKSLSAQVDPAMSTLIKDLKERGLLDRTLVIWMGEFGRTPNINARGAEPGRDHYPRAWSSVLFGGGIKGGQVIGRTDKEGATVEDRPISAVDLMATVCAILGVDYNKRIMTPIGRPVTIADKGARPIQELYA